KKIITEGFVQLAYRAHLQNNDGYTIQRTLAGFSSPDQFETAKLASIHAPTLIVWGRQDELTPLAMGEQFREGISGAKMAQFDQCGHLPEMEKPAEFNRAVLEFLGQ
ncbi:MAG TPA: alpha/beta fold hydrolase, partial [Nitrospirota bacterium]